NPAAERLLGWTEADVLGQEHPSLHEEKKDESGQSLANVLQGASYQGLPTRCRRKDGTVIEMSLSSAPLRDAAGTIFGVLNILMDLTEQKRLEDRLRQAQKMEAVG